MKTIWNIGKILLLALFSTLCAAQQSPPIAEVTGWATHHAGKVHYQYQVKNLGSLPIHDLLLGAGSISADGKRELTIGPETNPGTTSFWIPASSAARPDGWGVSYEYAEEGGKFGLRWIEGNLRKSYWPGDPDGPDTPRAKPEAAGIPPGATWNNFSVTLTKTDPAYLAATVLVSTNDQVQEVRVIKGDVFPPTLDIIANQIDEAHSRQDWKTFEIQTRTTDNIDPSPEVKLEYPGTANALHNSDLEIQRAQGRWIARFKQRPGNRYQLCFSAEDASGNKATKLFEYVVQKGGQGRAVEKQEAPSLNRTCSPAVMAKPFQRY